MRRLLIVGCSATKDPAPGFMPALDRYRGAYYQMIRQVPAGELPEIVILSAQFGFIPSDGLIRDYNRRLTKARVAELLKGDRAAELLLILSRDPDEDPVVIDEVCIAAGWLYRQLVDQVLGELERAKVIEIRRRVYTSGGIGTQRSQLKAWLAKGVASGLERD